jgi:hypothetical protein
MNYSLTEFTQYLISISHQQPSHIFYSKNKGQSYPMKFLICRNQQKSYTPREHCRNPYTMILYLQMTDCITWTYNQRYKDVHSRDLDRHKMVFYVPTTITQLWFETASDAYYCKSLQYQQSRIELKTLHITIIKTPTIATNLPHFKSK